MSGPRYFLRDHAFICATPHHWVILDRNQDQYLCIARQDFEQLFPWLHGGRSADADRDTLERSAQLASALLDRKILSTAAGPTKDARAVAPSHPSQALDTSNVRLSIARKSLAAPLVFYAAHVASRSLKRNPLAVTLGRVEQRKTQHHAASAANVRRYALPIAAFNALRLLVPRAYLCLFDSLALLEYLASYRLFPTWTFGVMTDPFQAHCWLETGDHVLNDTVERISLYTPIMRI
jgi:Transglutaminase-like superfamily